MGTKPPIWFDIVPDKYPCKCDYCGKQGNPGQFVYVELRDGKGYPDLIVHRACIGESWLASNEHGEPPRRRTVEKQWHARGWPPKLKSVKKKKIDYSIPKHMRKGKKGK